MSKNNNYDYFFCKCSTQNKIIFGTNCFIRMKNLPILFLLFFVGQTWAQPLDVMTMDTFELRKVRVNDSLSLAYVDEGTGAQTLLFVHGLGSYQKAWLKNIPALSGQYRCIAVDLPGYGTSDGISGGYAMTFFASVLADFIRTLQLERVVLVGHSMGGQIALHLALAAPDLLSRLVLVAPAGFELFSAQEKLWFQQVYTPAWVAAATPEQIRSNFKLNFFRMPEDANLMIEDRIRLSSDPGFDAYCAMVPRCVQGMLEEPVLERLSDIRLPSLIVFGAEDILIPNRLLHPGLTTQQVAETGRDKLPDSRLIMVPEAGHFVQWEKATEVNQAILDFLKN